MGRICFPAMAELERLGRTCVVVEGGTLSVGSAGGSGGGVVVVVVCEMSGASSIAAPSVVCFCFGGAAPPVIRWHRAAVPFG